MSQWPDQATRAFESWEREKKSKRYRYWSMLRSAKDEFIKITQQEAEESDTDPGAFFYYLKQTYGLQVETVDGNIAAEHVVVDEKKYLMFLMKFGS
jgi:hypothetical protein